MEVHNTEPITESKRRSLANLKPAWKKGVKQKAGPGRPKTREFIQFIRELYETSDKPQAMLRLVKLMEKRCPGELAHYLAGKPVTAIELSGPDKGKIEVHSTTQTDVEQELSKRGVFLPS